MKKTIGLSLLVALFLLVISACSSGNSGTKVTVTAVGLGDGPAFIAAAAYQTGDGKWQQLLPDKDGNFSFYVPDGETKYGVAVRCGDNFPLGNSGVINVFQLTTDETVSPRAHCMTNGEVSAVSGEIDLSGVSSATRYEIFGPGSGDDRSVNSTTHTGDYEVYVPHGGARDLIALAEDNSYNILAAKIVRGIDANKAVIYRDIALVGSDALKTHAIASFDVPSGMTGNFNLLLQTAGGTMYKDFGSSRSKAGGPVYAIANARHGDVYITEISASTNDNHRGVTHYSCFDAPDLPNNVSLSFGIDPFPTGNTVAAAANPTFPANHPDADVDRYVFITASPQALLRSYEVSSSWLGSKSSYAAPDLSSVPGFKNLQPARGESVRWATVAIKTSLTPVEYDSLPRTWEGVLPFPVKAGATIDMALISGDFTAP